ncbi:(2Fe-2S) ferredoxin domain-containing protein [Ruminococcus sp. JE7B6]|jgi:NADH:ubiquinone oxidoreductase subunit E|uniref:(2Fe-2S) ferredoxin domain-containing protein n=1 Tax=Ruminococcus sp. JE7B6 TaxID=3233380 RepID=UPI00293015DC|nr:(2Fe-2S) ferredoxin domain-containing protein [uncultured Ruminococcus sp.]
MNIQICVGSSCHLKGSEQVVHLFQKAIEERNLADKITLAGSFCIGRCNREGVTVQIDDEIITGVTPETFDRFFEKEILQKLN